MVVAIVSATISIIIVSLIAHSIGFTIPPYTVLAGICGMILGYVVQGWVIPAITRYREKK
jgi:hypothetical protein